MKTTTLLLNTLLGDQGGGTPPTPPTPPSGNWFDTLPADLKTETVTKFKSPEELARGYVNAQSLIGQKRLALPNDKWGQPEWDGFWKELGRPDSPDGYKLPADIKMPEGIKLDDAKLAKANAALHKAGLTPKQHEHVMRYYAETLGEQFTAEEASRKQAYETGINTLKQEWGDKFDANVDVAKSVLKKFGAPELIERLNTSGFGNDPVLVKMLNQIGSLLLEDNARGGDGHGLQVMDATRALREINSLKTDPEFMKAYNTADHPGHKAAIERWMELHQKAHPGKQND